MDRTKKWRKILAMMLTIVMMLQNVQSVVWATGTDSSTQETTVEKKSDSEDDKTATDEEQTKDLSYTVQHVVNGEVKDTLTDCSGSYFKGQSVCNGGHGRRCNQLLCELSPGCHKHR